MGKIFIARINSMQNSKWKKDLPDSDRNKSMPSHQKKNGNWFEEPLGNMQALWNYYQAWLDSIMYKKNGVKKDWKIF